MSSLSVEKKTKKHLTYKHIPVILGIYQNTKGVKQMTDQERIAYHNVLTQLFCVQCQLIDLRKAGHIEECSLVYEYLLDKRAKLDKQLADLDKQFANS
jgi:hypothetical protein